jgi:hypothetical protein
MKPPQGLDVMQDPSQVATIIGPSVNRVVARTNLNL